MENRHNANSLLSIVRYYGESITDDQADDINKEVDLLSRKEQEKFNDLVKFL